jgi:hypothetical protein
MHSGDDDRQLPNYREIPYRFAHTFSCPEGAWKARLDAKTCGKGRNVLLYFSELDTGAK